MMRIAGIPFLPDSGFSLAADLLRAQWHFDPAAPDAVRAQGVAFDQPAAGAGAASRSHYSSGASTLSIQSSTFVDADGVTRHRTVVGGRPGQDPGDPGPMTHQGTPGNDAIAGGPADDTIAGGPGDDTLSGGAGADTFLYAAGDGKDTITDLESGVDRLVILDEPGLSLSSDGSVTIIWLPDGGQITLYSAVPALAADSAPLG